MNLLSLVAYLDELLQVDSIHDAAHNGLQVEAGQEVKKIGLAVDSSLAVFQQAANERVDFLIVHHGLFWEGQSFHPLRGMLGRRVKTLFDAGVSLYGVHLPLDIHPEYGNNAALARILDLQGQEFFAPYYDIKLALKAVCTETLPLEDFADRVGSALGVKTLVWNFGPPKVSVVGIASGKATAVLPFLPGAGADTFLTGETAHNGYHIARELGLNVVHAGHYATETTGIKALGERLTEKYGLETVFLHQPTGL